VAIISSNTNDGYSSRYQQSSWSNARDNSSGTSTISSGSNHLYGIAAERTSARGGGNVYTIFRSFLYFDTSEISSTLSSVTLKVRGYTNGGGDIIAVKATSGIATLSDSDFSAIAGWDTTTDGSGGGDNESNVTKYSDTVSTWSTTGYNNISLNSQALTDMEDNDNIYICLLNYDYDLKDIAPTGYSEHRNGLYYSDNIGTSNDPYIDYTLAPTDNAVFMGMNF